VRKVLAIVSAGAFALVAAGCSTTSAVSANGNLKTCDDFFAYGTYVQSVTSEPPPSAVHHQMQKLESRLQVDGPTARSKTLGTTASRAVQAVKTNNLSALTDQMNAATGDCMSLGHFATGSSSIKSG
jgi:hypothetical protein